MNRLIKSSLAIALALAFTPSLAFASDCDSAVPKDQNRVGETRLSVLFWDVYDARLFTNSGDFDWQQRKQQRKTLVLDYLRDIKVADLVDKTAEEWQRLGFAHQDQQQWLDTLNQIWPNIKEGDCLALVENEDGHADFYQGDKLLGTIENSTFTEQFLAIWLSPESRYEDERDELTGASS
ncbi:chalcone isomerase-like protein [Idiomarina aquatica]|uniref:Chalcone isomerase-like protein n=1 Tax=Idiomarina aquatica TaxID=1327752 RepID=A0A4R6PRR7_9GAMM|nr:chalcone isomerase family protein [Idiomarina aquatica]TDP40821.1 chalcone isomerase-like protein [Idiomarina aquatica]